MTFTCPHCGAVITTRSPRAKVVAIVCSCGIETTIEGEKR